MPSSSDEPRLSSSARYAGLKVPAAGPATLGAESARRRRGRALPCEVVVFSSSGLLPRKEVIQPHLPVRLPCYDFTPLTLHTFDAYAPFGFGRRLRVQTTRVV